MPASYTCLHYHVVFSTKDRRPAITVDLQLRLFDYMGGIFASEAGRLLAAGGTDDHVHLLVSLAAQKGLSDVMRVVKTNSSRWLHQTFPDHAGFGWQDGYGAFTVSFSGLARVKEYIAGQAEHHRRVSFQEELVALLNRHRVPYDGRYIWK
ncbi:MAG: IS200/IS605 family transposase [Phycisphaerales bacterium]|nr:IS200/IS605 family transposase [Phycisphaerales bacterium]